MLLWITHITFYFSQTVQATAKAYWSQHCTNETHISIVTCRFPSFVHDAEHSIVVHPERKFREPWQLKHEYVLCQKREIKEVILNILEYSCTMHSDADFDRQTQFWLMTTEPLLFQSPVHVEDCWSHTCLPKEGLACVARKHFHKW